MSKLSFGILLGLLFCSTKLHGQVTFVIEALPKTTPDEDTIFIAGSFNNWLVNDADYMLKKQLDGRFAITLPADTGTIEFKFCRGSWMKVETNDENQYVPNRKFRYGNGEVVHIKISNWQDLGGLKPVNYIVFYFFASAFYALVLIILAFRIQKRSYNKFTGFLLINIIIIILLLGSVFYNETNLIWQSYIALLAQCLLFAWGPALYIFSIALQDQKIPSRLFLHFIPVAILLIFSVLRMLNLQIVTFMTCKINPYLSWGDSIIIWASVVFNIVYHIKASKYVSWRYKSERKILSERLLVLVVCVISILALVLFIFDYILLYYEIRTGIIVNYELILVAFTLIVYAETYFLWRYPEVLREQPGQFIIENAGTLKDRLENLMQKEKPYKNPDLSVADLSEMLEIKPHVLSKILNDHFHKSFRDYINEFRVDEFICLAESEDYKNFTFLAIAYEVGFNSKSTFNLAFKKVTRRSPREYFKKN